jgi:hypothetical protein
VAGGQRVVLQPRDPGVLRQQSVAPRDLLQSCARCARGTRWLDATVPTPKCAARGARRQAQARRRAELRQVAQQSGRFAYPVAVTLDAGRRIEPPEQRVKPIFLFLASHLAVMLVLSAATSP